MHREKTLRRKLIWAALPATLAVGIATSSAFGSSLFDLGFDFGKLVDGLLGSVTERQFGFRAPLEASSIDDLPRRPGQPVSEIVDVAKGLRAEIFSRDVGHNADQLAFWPSDDKPTHIIFCVEEFAPKVIGAFANGTQKLTPGVQRIDLRTRRVDTIVRGTAGCDGIRRTPWQTILFTEEDGSLSGDGHLGNAFELLDPLGVTNITVGRGPARGTFFDANGVTKSGAAAAAAPSAGGFGIAIRQALMEMAWEGIAITPEGVLIAGDELRPGTVTSPTIGGPDSDGGAIFKFVPDVPRTTSAPISDLSQSPFVAGRVFALRVICQANNPNSFGQGCEKGNAVWVLVSALQARGDADRSGATGYYRPEDLSMDPNVDGLRFCFTNTGDRAALNFGEVLCGMDNDPLFATTTLVADAFSGSMVTSRAPVDLQVFLDGDEMLNQPDNIDIQKPTNNVYVIEDNDNGDVFACLPDGEDRNTSTDGCVLVLSVKDQTAEPTGFMFTEDGDTAFVFIQHSADDNDPMARSSTCPAPGVIDAFRRDDYCTDDLIRITGFRVPRKR
jgi:hypothetical protein